MHWPPVGHWGLGPGEIEEDPGKEISKKYINKKSDDCRDPRIGRHSITHNHKRESQKTHSNKLTSARPQSPGKRTPEQRAAGPLIARPPPLQKSAKHQLSPTCRPQHLNTNPELPHLVSLSCSTTSAAVRCPLLPVGSLRRTPPDPPEQSPAHAPEQCVRSAADRP